MAGIGHHHRSAGWLRHSSEDWLTPPWIIEAVGPFDLDPCTPVTMPWKTARARYSVEDDGLSKPWSGRVWLNPPYGRKAAAWLHRMSEHGNGIAFMFARTETDMFARYVWACADSVLFLRGRVDFYLPDGSKRGNAGGPSVLIAYSAEDGRRLWDCGIPGVVVPLAGARSNPGRCTRANPLTVSCNTNNEKQMLLGERPAGAE